MSSLVRYFLFTPPEEGYGPAELISEGFQPIRSKNRPTHWRFPRKRPKGVILYFHGNGENASQWMSLVDDYPELDRWSIVLGEYRGYAKPDTDPLCRSQNILIDDAVHLYRQVMQGSNGDSSLPIVAWGRSLGGSIAAHLAAEVEVDGLIIESSFCSLSDAVKSIEPLVPKPLAKLALTRFPLKTKEAVSRIGAPVLIAHSKTDGMFPIQHAERIFEAAVGPKAMHRFRGSHNHDKSGQTSFRRAVLSLCNSAEAHCQVRAQLKVR